MTLLPSRRDPWPLAACAALAELRPIVTGPEVESLPDLPQLCRRGRIGYARSHGHGPDRCGPARTRPDCLVRLRAVFRPETAAAVMATAVSPTAPGRVPVA